MKYTAVIGLEIHCELLTETKVFCSCRNEFSREENLHTCPVCTGLPGALPVLNRGAVEKSIAAALALGCAVQNYTRWDRKNYFYPDSPKAYQISQLYAPYCVGGGLEINGKFIRLNHIHLEEDAGKLVHDNVRGQTRIDYNRCGVPLMEIVTEPDMRSAKEAAAFVEMVRRTLVYAGVSDGRMEQGSLRADANVSLMPEGASEFGTRTETKNLNSFKFITQAIEYEIERQAEILGGGGKVTQETRRFLADEGVTAPLRSKEDAHDYRYVPDADIPPLRIANDEIEAIRRTLPRLPAERALRYANEGVPPADIETLLERKFVSDFLDACADAGAPLKIAANAVKGEVLRFVNANGLSGVPVSPGDISRAIKLAGEGKIELNSAVKKMLETGAKPDDLVVSGDAGEVSDTVKEVLEANEKAVAQYVNGDKKVFGFLMGECSKRLRGKALPALIKTTLEAELERK